MGTTPGLFIKLEGDPTELVAALQQVAAVSGQMAAQVKAAMDTSTASTQQFSQETTNLKESIANAQVQARIAHAETMAYGEALRRQAQASRDAAQGTTDLSESVANAGVQARIAHAETMAYAEALSREVQQASRIARAETAAYAEDLRRQAQAAREAAVAQEEAAAAATGMGTQAAATATSIRGMFPVLSDLRQIVRLAFGITALIYFAENLSKIYDELSRLSMAMGGFGLESQKIFDQWVKLNEKLYETPKTLAEARHRIDEVNAGLVMQDTVIQGLSSAVSNYVQGLMELAQGNLAGATTYFSLAAAATEANNLQTKLQNTLSTLHEAESKLLGTEKEGLPTKREISVAMKELIRDHQQYTKVQLEALANEKLLSDPAFRAHIDSLIAGTKTHTLAVRDYSDALAEQLQRTREVVDEMESGERPARQRIELAIQKQIDAADREITKYRELEAKGKISRDELSKREKEFTDLMVALSRERSDRLAEESKKEMEALDKLDPFHLRAHQRALEETTALNDQYKAMQQVNSALGLLGTSFTKLTDAQLRALPTEREVKRAAEEISRQYVTLTMDQARLVAEVNLADPAYRKHIDTLISGISRTRELQTAIRLLAKEYPELTQAQLQQLAVTKLEDPAFRQLVDDMAAGQRQLTGLGTTARSTRGSLQQLLETIKQVNAAHREGVPLIQAFTDAVREEGAASKQAAQQETIANVEAIGQMLLSRRAYAEVETVVESAEGFASLAVMDWWGAAQHFTSALKWAIVAKQSADTGSGAGAGGKTKTKAASTTSALAKDETAEATAAAAAAGLLAPGYAGAIAPSGQVNVIIMGEPDGATWLAGVLTTHVTKRGGKLVASHSVRPVQAGA